MKPLQNVLVPVDGSLSAIHAAEYASSIAGKYGAQVHLIHVIDLNQYMNSFEQVSGSGYLPQEIMQAGKKILQAAQDRVDADVSCRQILEIGRPAEKILSSADRIHADLIIMSSRGMSALKQALLGSVSQYVLLHAPCPVLIVK